MWNVDDHANVSMSSVYFLFFINVSNMKRFLFFENERTDVRTVFKIMQDDVGMWDGKHRTQNPL